MYGAHMTKHQVVVQCNSRPWHTYCRGFSRLWYTFSTTQESDWLANIVCPCECSLDQSSLRHVPAWCWPGLLEVVFSFLRLGHLLVGASTVKKEVWDNLPTLPTPCQPLTFFYSFDCGCCSDRWSTWKIGLWDLRDSGETLPLNVRNWTCFVLMINSSLLKHGDECFEPASCPCLWKGKEFYPGDMVSSPCHQWWALCTTHTTHRDHSLLPPHHLWAPTVVLYKLVFDPLPAVIC